MRPIGTHGFNERTTRQTKVMRIIDANKRIQKTQTPRIVGGLDLDLKWIITRNEVWPLIEAHICSKCLVVVALLYLWGVDSVQSQLNRIFRNKTVYQQVACMLLHDHNWALCWWTPIEVDWSSIDPVSYEVDWGVRSMWIESGSGADRPLDTGKLAWMVMGCECLLCSLTPPLIFCLLSYHQRASHRNKYSIVCLLIVLKTDELLGFMLINSTKSHY